MQPKRIVDRRLLRTGEMPLRQGAPLEDMPYIERLQSPPSVAESGTGSVP
jgi:hypothetical protein